MKDMLRSKVIISFIVFVIGVTYFNSLSMKEFNDGKTENEIAYVSK